jgi:hypothetical protein
MPDAYTVHAGRTARPVIPPVSPCCAAGLRNKGLGRFCCTACRRYIPKKRRPSRLGMIRRDRRGRAWIWLGKGHGLANSGGWQWLSRYLAAADLGRRLFAHEHVLHRAGRRVDRASTLEVVERRPARLPCEGRDRGHQNEAEA